MSIFDTWMCTVILLYYFRMMMMWYCFVHMWTKFQIALLLGLILGLETRDKKTMLVVKTTMISFFFFSFLAEFAWKKEFISQRRETLLNVNCKTSNFVVPTMASCCFSFKYWFFSNKYDYKRLLYYMHMYMEEILS